MVAAALALFVVLAGAGPASAAAPRDSGLLLSIAARSWPTYSDITANLARNNIMESLRDLGADTPYRHGEPVDPRVERRVQPNCEPLPDWRFTLGSGYQIRAVAGPWGALSIVRNPFATPIVTQNSTDLLDPQGLPTGKSIGGATTIRLSAAEGELASKRSLWIQGGTAADPILNQEFPGPQYGFGALRCAIDNVNRDNVEYVAYPAGVTHVFCFAYYVEPPPTSGTIVVRKEVTGAPAGTNETFGFAGNISYNPGGRFSLSVKGGSPATETFLRGATGPSHQPWTVRELGVPDWRLADLACVSPDHTSSVESSVASGEASIHLGAGDLVTCTYSDRYDPPPHGLTLRKVTEGGVGHFSYTVTPVGGGDAAHAVATTTEEDIAAAADPAPLDLAGGRYGVTEQMPSSSGGRWVLKAVECDGDSKPIDQPIEVSVPDRAVVSCTFRNAFIPRGEITISKITQGDVDTSSFLITRMSEEVAEYQQPAKTTKQGVPVRAHGDDTDRLELGRYAILDIPPPPGEGRLGPDQGRMRGRGRAVFPGPDRAVTDRRSPPPTLHLHEHLRPHACPRPNVLSRSRLKRILSSPSGPPRRWSELATWSPTRSASSTGAPVRPLP